MPHGPFDKTDRAILTELQGHGRTANVDLAEKVRLSPSACLRRTKALEEAGLIVDASPVRIESISPRHAVHHAPRAPSL